MGADMLVAAVAIKKDAKPDYEAGKKFIEKLDITDEALLTSLIDEGQLDEDVYFDNDGKPLATEIREWLIASLDTFEETLNCRYVTTLGVRDLWLYVTGGLSHGDSNDELDIMWRIGCIDGLLDAMGFVENYWEMEKAVTPEEEQAAIESIAQAGKSTEVNVPKWTIVQSNGRWVTRCPHCEALDSIAEHDTGVRWNPLNIQDPKTGTALLGDSGEYEGDGWICTNCLADNLDAPDDFEITDWI